MKRITRSSRSAPAHSPGNEHAWLAAVVDCSSDAILSKNLKGTVLTWNKSAERLFGYSAREMIGSSITLLIPPERLAEERLILSKLRRGDRVDHYETIRLHKNGSPIHVSLSIAPVHDATGRVVGAAKIVRDITERKKMEAALRDSQERMRAIVATAVDAVITIDERGTLESINPATERLFGYTGAELLGRNVKLLMPEPYQSEHDGYLDRYRQTGTPRIIGLGREVAGRKKDGSVFPMSLAVSEAALGARRIFVGVIHDLTRRRELERQILEASVNEQRRIGQDLHDGLCQDLIGLAFQADFAVRSLAARSAPEAADLQKLAAAIRDAAAQARQLSHGLNPIALSGGGLTMALETMAARISQSFRVACRFRCDAQTPDCDDATATHLYRIAQEAVGNAIKHGKAQHVEISINSGPETMLSVRDDGVGLPRPLLQAILGNRPNGASDADLPAAGIGLQSMRFRAHMIGGSLQIRPRSPSGTEVTCTVGSENHVNSKEPAAPKARRRRHATRRTR